MLIDTPTLRRIGLWPAEIRPIPVAVTIAGIDYYWVWHIKPLLGRTSHHCQYIYGFEKKDWVRCPMMATKGSYCEAHHLVTHMTKQQANQAAAQDFQIWRQRRATCGTRKVGSAAAQRSAVMPPISLRYLGLDPAPEPGSVQKTSEPDPEQEDFVRMPHPGWLLQLSLSLDQTTVPLIARRLSLSFAA